MVTPIEAMLDSVEWVATEGEPEICDLPHETHRGLLKIAGMGIEVVQLSDGQRLVTEAGMITFLGFLHGIALEGGVR